MSDELNFSDEPLNTQSDFDNWEPAPEFAPPPPAATYQAYLSEIREMKENETKIGKRLFTTLDFRIVGGQYDDRAVTWQRVSNSDFDRRDGHHTSLMLDMVKSAGNAQAPRSNREFAVALKGMKERGPAATFKIQTDWRGFCTGCYEKALMAATQTTSSAEAKERATNEQKNDASKGATKAKNYRAFPTLPNGQKADSFICPDCKGEVRAQVRVQRFLP